MERYVKAGKNEWIFYFSEKFVNKSRMLYRGKINWECSGHLKKFKAFSLDQILLIGCFPREINFYLLETKSVTSEFTKGDGGSKR